ncbi:MAG: PQQ-binding-like beta-propeller repeat protein [Proteobacteria bacterium]|nr:PQQ-binding-like beta-propeller repeat protein [Pseudomonadota bacterium]
MLISSLRMKTVLFLAMALALSGCGMFDWLGDAPPRPLPGRRISVLQLDQRIDVDPELTEVPVRLPRPVVNAEWPQAGGEPNHAMYHLAAGGELKVAWRVSIGSGSDSDRKLLSPPVVGEGRVYVVDADSEVSAIDPATGKILWRAEARAKENRSDAVQPGGIGYAEGKVFVGTGYGQVLALSASDGKELWRQPVPGPVRSPPTIAGGRVFVLTVDNQTFALDANDGHRLWSHAGIPETAGLLGGASPAVDGGTLVVPYSSGEIFALRTENGRVIWSDSLVAARRSDTISTLADIRGQPVVDRGLLIAISNSGRMAAIDLRSGGRAWDSDLGGVEMPWVAGDFVYVLTSSGEVVCLRRSDGRVRWVIGIGRFIDPTATRPKPLIWTGPVLAGDRLIVAGAEGEVLALSPYTGDVLGHIKVPDGIMISPVIADQTVYLLSDGGELIALR